MVETSDSGQLSLYGETHVTRSHLMMGAFPYAVFTTASDEDCNTPRRFKATLIEGDPAEPIIQELEVIPTPGVGLPRGNDPAVLLALLHMLFETPTATNEIYFRKAKILELLDWKDTPKKRLAVASAIKRYYSTTFLGTNTWRPRGMRGPSQVHRRLIDTFGVADERKIRHRQPEQFDLTWVRFNPDFVDEMRVSPLSVNFSLYMRLREQMERRLLEYTSYLVHMGQPSFSVDVCALAFDHLGISPSGNPAPSQCWQRMERSFRVLEGHGYLDSFGYDGTRRLVTGVVAPRFRPERLMPLSPLRLGSSRRATLVTKLLSLGTQSAKAESVVARFDDADLPNAELIVKYILRDRRTNPNKPGRGGKPFNWGGWVFKALNTFLETRQLDPCYLALIGEEDEPPEGVTLLHATPAPAPSQPFTAEAVRAHLAARMDAVRRAGEAAGAHPIATALSGTLALLRELESSYTGAAPDSVQKLEEALDALDHSLDEGVLAAYTEEEREGFTARAREQLAPYRSRMEAVVYEQTLGNITAKLLREQFGVPRFSLFSL